MTIDYAALFCSVPTPCLVLTPELCICEVNTAYLEVTGRSREELLGQDQPKPIGCVHHDGDAAERPARRDGAKLVDVIRPGVRMVVRVFMSHGETPGSAVLPRTDDRLPSERFSKNERENMQF